MQKPNLDKYGFPAGSPISRDPSQIPWEFGVNQGIQAKRIRTSIIQIKSFTMLSGNAVGTGGIGNGSVSYLITTLTPNVPHQNDINFAIPYIALYQGTYPGNPNANYQIYPFTGGSITPFSYSVQGHTDWESYDGINSSWRGVVKNNTGGSQDITLVTQWKYIDFNSGTVS